MFYLPNPIGEDNLELWKQSRVESWWFLELLEFIRGTLLVALLSLGVHFYCHSFIIHTKAMPHRFLNMLGIIQFTIPTPSLPSKYAGYRAAYSIESNWCSGTIFPRLRSSVTGFPTSHRCPLWCLNVSRARVASLATSKSLSNSKVLLRSDERVGSWASWTSRELVTLRIMISTCIGKLLCEWWTFSKDRSFPINYVDSKNEEEGDAKEDGRRICQWVWSNVWNCQPISM